MLRPRVRGLLAAALLVGTFAVLYRSVLPRLVRDWATDDNYSHGFVVVPLAVYFAWQRRRQLAQANRSPSVIGLLIVVASIGVLGAGVLGSEFFLTRVSILGVLAGTVIFMAGWEHLSILAFPIAFLLLMIPIPAIVFNQLAFPLQLVASRFGEAVLTTLGVPVLREGNVITLATTSLEVAEACSGIRSLISLSTVAIVYGYFLESRVWVRIALALAAIPVAIVANGVRVAGTGLTAHYFGAEAAEGFFHSFSGFLVFLVAFLLLLIIHRLLEWSVPARGRHANSRGAA